MHGYILVASYSETLHQTSGPKLTVCIKIVSLYKHFVSWASSIIYRRCYVAIVDACMYVVRVLSLYPFSCMNKVKLNDHVNMLFMCCLVRQFFAAACAWIHSLMVSLVLYLLFDKLFVAAYEGAIGDLPSFSQNYFRVYAYSLAAMQLGVKNNIFYFNVWVWCSYCNMQGELRLGLPT